MKTAPTRTARTARTLSIPGLSGLPTLPTEDVIHADHHSLFWETKQHEMVPIGEEAPGFFEEQKPFTLYKLFIGDFDEAGNGMQRILNKLQNSKPEDVLEFHISSRGGLVEELLELYNICNTLFYKKVVTYVNYGYSAGGWAFLIGSDRVVYEHSDLMFHSYSGGAYGKRDDMITHLEHSDKRTNKFLMGTLEPYFSNKEIKKMLKGKDYWLNSVEMLERGIATHIMINGEVQTAEDYLHPERKAEKDAKAKEVEAEAKAVLEKLATINAPKEKTKTKSKKKNKAK